MSIGSLRVRGGRSLRGEVRVRGAKNTLPKSMVAALLTDQECLLSNVAGIRDVEIVGRMIRALGGEVQRVRLGRNPPARRLISCRSGGPRRPSSPGAAGFRCCCAARC